MTDTAQPNRLDSWILAVRPKTLWASVAPVIVGTSVAWRDGMSHWPSALAALCGAVLIQIGTNLTNDLFDYHHGADTGERLGPVRVTQAGLISPDKIKRASIGVFGVAFLIGIHLVIRAGWPIVAIGLSSIVAAVLYTGGPFPYGYRGLGDLFVFIFFGPVAVVGTYYVQSLQTNATIWISSIPMGALVTAILVVNNMRDIETDRRAGKMTLAVRIGKTGSVVEYSLLLFEAMIAPLVLYFTDCIGAGVFFASLIVIPALQAIARMAREPKADDFNRLLAETARLSLVYALAFAIGINLRL